jgi:hypothetical protein
VIRAAAISIAGLLSVGCRIVDGCYPESTYQLRIVTERDASYSVRLSTDTSNGAILPSDGRIDVNVPQQLWGQKRLGHIPVSRANPRPNIEILDEGCGFNCQRLINFRTISPATFLLNWIRVTASNERFERSHPVGA